MHRRNEARLPFLRLDRGALMPARARVHRTAVLDAPHLLASRVAPAGADHQRPAGISRCPIRQALELVEVRWDDDGDSGEFVVEPA
jgi:hypothetical protein